MSKCNSVINTLMGKFQKRGSGGSISMLGFKNNKHLDM